MEEKTKKNISIILIIASIAISIWVELYAFGYRGIVELLRGIIAHLIIPVGILFVIFLFNTILGKGYKLWKYLFIFSIVFFLFMLWTIKFELDIHRMGGRATKDVTDIYYQYQNNE